MAKILIALDGCDDSTSVIMELSTDEMNFLLKLSEEINTKSTYGCQPRLRIEEVS